MLTHLAIENFAIIDRIELELGPGLVCLTGETGTGKSIVIDAVGGLLGNRLGPEVIRAGASHARIEGIFQIDSNQALAHVLDEFGITIDDEMLIVSRDVARSGRSIARVNGRAVPVSLLQRVGRYLIDLHGQGDHLTLLRVSEHTNFLDGYAETAGLRQKVADIVARITAIRTERHDLLRDQREIARQQDLLRFQVEEIQAANLQTGEDDALHQERLLLVNSEKLVSATNAVREALSEAEGLAALDRLGQASASLADIVRIDSTLESEQQVLETAIDQLTELSRRLRQYRDQIEFSPDRLQELEERLDLIRALQRKYGPTIPDIIDFGKAAGFRLEQLVHHDERVEELSAQESALLGQLAGAALTLSQARQSAANGLATDLERELAELNMPHARFHVDIRQELDPNEGVPLPDGRRVAFDSTGIDQIEFQIATNPGEGFKPLVRVVSGGETARLMLALKSVLARADTVPTLIFDEVDAGIGGQTAVVVGRKLAALAQERQIICVTHLSQIAAFGDCHVAVSKRVSDGRTTTHVKVLEQDERVDELASMVGGQSGHSSTRAHARDMLLLAEDWKVGQANPERGA